MSSFWEFNVLPVRLIAALIPLALIATGGWFNDDTTHWTFLFASALVLGYVHFIVATTYQIKGIMRSDNTHRLLGWFSLLMIIGVSISAGFILTGHTLLLGILTIGYFVLHVLANEHTFLERAVSLRAPYWTFLSLVVPIGAIYGASLLHPSLYFDFGLLYPTGFNLAQRTEVLATYAPVALLTPLAIVAAAIFTVVMPSLLYWRYQAPTAAVWFAFIGLTSLATLVFVESIVFMYVLHFVLVYHFILLSLLFIKPMIVKGKKAISEYAALHILLLTPLLIALGIFMNNLTTTEPIDWLFQFEIFIAVSLVHITASLLNEPWFKRLFIDRA